jgi:hypothetical protein
MHDLGRDFLVDDSLEDRLGAHGSYVCDEVVTIGERAGLQVVIL